MRNPLDRLLQRLPRRARVVADWLIGIGIAVLIVLAIRSWVVTPYAIPTPSMEPTLHCSKGANAKPSAPGSSVQPGQGGSTSSQTPGISSYQCQGASFLGHSFADRVLVSRLSYEFGSPQRGDIVVFKPPHAASELCSGVDTSVLVKRLIGLPGDTLVERRGVVYVNGKKLDEPYVTPDRRDALSGIWQIGKGQYFFMGDNRKYSCDSREWGTVPRGSLIGPVFMTYWPPNRIRFF